MRFLADESCDSAIVSALRAAGHDVLVVAETMPGSSDAVVLDASLNEARALITKDKDFGPSYVRSAVPSAVVDFVSARGAEIAGSFVVIEPAGARVTRIDT